MRPNLKGPIRGNLRMLGLLALAPWLDAGINVGHTPTPAVPNGPAPGLVYSPNEPTARRAAIRAKKAASRAAKSTR